MDKLDDLINNYHSTIKMKPVYVKSSTYIDSSKENNGKDPKFKIVDILRILKYKNIFAKGYTTVWSENVFVIKKVKNTVPWTYVINDLNAKEIFGTFYEEELQKAKQEMLCVVTITMICSTLVSLETLNIFRDLYITQSNIYDGDFIAKIVSC